MTSSRCGSRPRPRLYRGLGEGGDQALGSSAAAAELHLHVAMGNAVYLSGDSALQYQASTAGAIKINAAVQGASVFGSTAVSAAMRSLIAQVRSRHALETNTPKSPPARSPPRAW